MKLKKLKLNALSEAGLKDKEMNALKGGYLGCRCSCYWADRSGVFDGPDCNESNNCG